MRQCYERVHPDFMRLYVHFAPSYLARMRQVLGSYTALVNQLGCFFRSIYSFVMIHSS